MKKKKSAEAVEVSFVEGKKPTATPKPKSLTPPPKYGKKK